MTCNTFQESQTCFNVVRASNYVLKIAAIPRAVDVFEVLEVLEAVQARNSRKAKTLVMVETLLRAQISFFLFFCEWETSIRRMMGVGHAGQVPDLCLADIFCRRKPRAWDPRVVLS